jgi:hypothetical protein
LFAACYSPAYQDCEVLCASGTCPSGFRCDQGVCRIEGATGACGQGSSADASHDAPPDGDADSDGVVNAMDNCQAKANPDQNDEDRDGKGDVCDPCPIGITNPTAADADMDGDGVGDFCDPQNDPSRPHRIVVFEGFKSPPASMPMFQPSQTAWTITGGTASVNVGPNMRAAMLWPQGNNTSDSLAAGFTLTTIGSPPAAAGVAQFYEDAVMSGVVCQIGRDSAAEQGMKLWVPATPGTAVFAMYAVNPQVYFSVAMGRDGQAYACVDNMNHMLMRAFPVNATPNSRIGLYASGVAVTFEYVMIVSRMN